MEAMTEPALPEKTGTDAFSAPRADLLETLILLAKRRKVILWFTSIVTVLTTIIVLFIPNRYTATTVLLPPQQNSSMSSALLGQLGGSGALASLAGGSLGIKNPGDMYVALFRSRTVEDALIQRFGLMARYHKKNMFDTRKEFETRNTVILGVKDGLITVSVTDRDPRFAAQLANAYVDEFRKHSDTLAITEASQRRAFFQQQLFEANGKLAKADEALKITEQATGVLQLDSQARALIESAAVLRGQITDKEVQLQSMHSFATSDNPQYILAQQELDALKAQLARIAGPGGSVGANVGLAVGNIPQAGIAYMNSLRDVRYYETVVQLLSRQFEIAKLDEARQGTIQVSDVAVPPDKKSSPLRMLIVILAALGAFIVASLWILGQEAIRTLPAQRRVKLGLLFGRNLTRAQ